MKRVWAETRKIIQEGVQLIRINKTVSTNFTQSTINKIIFAKIHASRAYYEIKPNRCVGTRLISDTDILPDERRITKHFFWMTKQFIKEILQNKWS